MAKAIAGRFAGARYGTCVTIAEIAAAEKVNESNVCGFG
jgi:hypothetical protein